MLLLTTVVMLLPIYGSWIDVHFAASQPDHQHIYFGKVDLNHHRDGNKDVVNLPNQDATSQITISILLTDEEILIHPDDMANLSFRLADEYLSPEDAFIPPPDHPPRI
ncbi:MAG: hypothetical protein WAM60_10030 [Candidatus Promineifilaceae bacterium]